MRKEHTYLLVCPSCQSELSLNSVEASREASVQSGQLKCTRCARIYPIVRGIPRFVSSDNYAAGFGYQWLKHRDTQLDSKTGLSISRDRFFNQTKWQSDLSNQLILEAGCGAGRFTECAVATKAMVVSFDLSQAVEANYENNGHHDNLLIVQASIFEMPFPKGQFDKAFCFGVLQHTPDPYKAFTALTETVKKGGELCIDIYRNYWKAWVIGKYYIRPFLTRINPENLYKAVVRYIDFMWPIACLLRKIPLIGPKLNLILCIPDHSNLGVSEILLKQWAYLDCFDMFNAKYDSPQTLGTVKKWLVSSGLKDFTVCAGELDLVIGRGIV